MDDTGAMVQSTYDAFLSHNSRHKPHVEQVASWLQRQGFRTFFDRDDLRAGRSWITELERALRQSRSVVVFFGPDSEGRPELGGWQDMEIRASLNRQVEDKKGGQDFPVICVMLPGVMQPDSIGDFLKLNTWISFRESVSEEVERLPLLRLMHAIRGEPFDQIAYQAGHWQTVSIDPFMGLRAFDVEDRRYFHGRSADIARLTRAIRDESRGRFLALLGASGSGKSSLARAGLIPSVCLGEGIPESERWDYTILKPRNDPFQSLALALRQQGSGRPMTPCLHSRRS